MYNEGEKGKRRRETCEGGKLNRREIEGKGEKLEKGFLKRRVFSNLQENKTGGQILVGEIGGSFKFLPPVTRPDSDETIPCARSYRILPCVPQNQRGFGKPEL